MSAKKVLEEEVFLEKVNMKMESLLIDTISNTAIWLYENKNHPGYEDTLTAALAQYPGFDKIMAKLEGIQK